MKTIALIIALIPILAFADTFESESLSGSDLAAILQINAFKNKITFDSSKELIMRYTSGKSHQDFPIGNIQRLSLVSYSPNKDGGEGTIGVIVSRLDENSKGHLQFRLTFPNPTGSRRKVDLQRAPLKKVFFPSKDRTMKIFLSWPTNSRYYPKNRPNIRRRIPRKATMQELRLPSYSPLEQG
jgi:hypothetical protein